MYIQGSLRAVGSPDSDLDPYINLLQGLAQGRELEKQSNEGEIRLLILGSEPERQRSGGTFSRDKNASRLLFFVLF